MPARWFVLSILLLLPSSTLLAGDVPSLRRLCIDAPLVVMATPADPVTPTRFRIEVVLRGKALRTGDLLEPQGLEANLLRSFDEPNVADGKPRPRRVERALLFLSGGSKPNTWKVEPGGYRFCTDDGKLLVPKNQAGAIEYRPEGRWPVVVYRVKNDLETIADLQTRRRLGRPHRRVQALMDWINSRREEFKTLGDGTDEAPVGWDHLQIDVFDWILASADPAEAWKAVRLYANLNEGDLLQLTSPVFSTPTGRQLLLQKATDEKVLTGDRVRALKLLGQSVTLWPGAKETRAGATLTTSKEQQDLLKDLRKILVVKDDRVIQALVQAIIQIAQPPAGVPGVTQRSQEILPDLITSFKGAYPGAGRDELAWTISGLATPERWKELTGNPPGVCACMRDLERKGNTLLFWLALRSPTLRVHEAPVLVLEKLNRFGFIAETKRQPLTFLNFGGNWNDGWNGEDSLATQIDLSKLSPNTFYRLRVEGFVGKGKDRLRWSSEAHKIYQPTTGKPINDGTSSTITIDR